MELKPPLPPAALEVGVPACEDSGTFAADAGSAGTQIRAPKCPWSPRPSSPPLRGQCVPQTRSRGCPEQRQQAAGARETSPQGPLRSWGGARAPRAEDPGAEGAFHASSASAALLQLPGCFARSEGAGLEGGAWGIGGKRGGGLGVAGKSRPAAQQRRHKA